MATPCVYSYRLVGFLVLALLLVLGAGCCGNSCSKDRQALETDNGTPCLVSVEDVTYAQEDDAALVYDEPAESEYETDMPMGYREPGYGDTMEAEIVTEDACNPEWTEDMDTGSSEDMTCYEEEASRYETEEYGMVDDDDPAHYEMAGMSDVTEEEYDEGMVSDGLTDGMDESYSNTIAPWIGGADETPIDPNLHDAGSDMDDTSCDAEVGEEGDDLASEPSP